MKIIYEIKSAEGYWIPREYKVIDKTDWKRVSFILTNNSDYRLIKIEEYE